METHVLITIILLPLSIIICIGLYIRERLHGKSRVQKWARDNGYQILSLENRVITLRGGPFSHINTHDPRLVYFVIVDTDDGERKCWLRCGSYWRGAYSDDLEVVWDDEKDSYFLGERLQHHIKK